MDNTGRRGIVIDDYGEINTAKANFDEIYVMDDPRSYYSVLGGLDYMIPDVAAPVIRQVLAAKASDGKKPIVLDVGCSYGINAAVHRFPLSFDTLRRRYARRELVELSSDDLLRLDANYFAAWPDRGLASFIGLDVSEPAILYAKSVGLIADGVIADLEENELTSDAARIVSRGRHPLNGLHRVPGRSDFPQAAGADEAAAMGDLLRTAHVSFRWRRACSRRAWLRHGTPRRGHLHPAALPKRR
jgi:SAM-dependent methyltransferase